MNITRKYQLAAIQLWNHERIVHAPPGLRELAASSAPWVSQHGNAIVFRDNIGAFSLDEVPLFQDTREGAFNFYINSGGGCGLSAVRIHDHFKGRVRIATITRRCASAAVLIAMVADRIRIERGAFFMFHAAQIAAFGSRENLLEHAKKIDELTARYIEIVSDRTGQPYAAVAQWMGADDRYFSAEEALELGLVDEIIEPPAVEVKPEPPLDDMSRVITALRNLGTVTCDRSKLAREFRAFLSTVKDLDPLEASSRDREAGTARDSRRGSLREPGA